LENAVVRAAAISDGIIRLKDLPERLQRSGNSQVQDSLLNAETTTANEKWVSLAEIEGHYVAKVLEHTRGNKQASARLLEIDRKTLDRMIKRHNLSPQKRELAYFPNRQITKI
jgi:DNA-binding NtrC family response regulator